LANATLFNLLFHTLGVETWYILHTVILLGGFIVVWT
jgi:hypothetical protein